MTLLLSIILAVLSPADSIDIEVQEFMHRWKLRGMQIAATRNGDTILDRSYGWADVEGGRHMESGTTMRIASVSKLFTATGIMVLKDRDELKLSDHIFGKDGFLSDYDRYIRDKRYYLITVEDLLRHEGGFSQKGGDPMFSGRRGLDNEALLQRELARPLAFYPGTAMEYSNIGYLLLSKVIETVTGQKYEKWMQENVLEPAGITDMRLAFNTPGKRYPDEAGYYTDNGDRSRCYDKNDIRGLSGAGAWTATATDLCRLASVIDGKDDVPDIISKESVFEMTCWYDPHTFSIGWNDTHPLSGWTRTGSYSGTSALLWYFPDGECLALITNTSSWKGSRFSGNTKALLKKIKTKLINFNR